MDNTQDIPSVNYVSYDKEGEYRWNCTEVYRRNAERWQIIQTHWSYTQRV